ncbi:MAG: hypothetical protein AAGH76_13340 [Pseudomonadota bacterium]
MDDNDDIPLLTEVIRRERRSTDRLTEAQVRRISAASAGLIVRVVKSALTDIERQLAVKLSRELNEQLPAIVLEALRDDAEDNDATDAESDDETR